MWWIRSLWRNSHLSAAQITDDKHMLITQTPKVKEHKFNQTKTFLKLIC